MEIADGTTLILSNAGGKEILEYKSKHPHATITEMCNYFSKAWGTPISQKMVENVLSERVRRVQSSNISASSRRNNSRKRSYEEYNQEQQESAKHITSNFQQSSFQTNQQQANYLSSNVMKPKSDIVNQHTENMGKQGMTMQLLSNLQTLEREHREKFKMKQQLQNNFSQETYLHNNIQHQMNNQCFEGGRPLKHQKMDVRTNVGDMYFNIHSKVHQKQADQASQYQKHIPLQDQVSVRKQDFPFSQYKIPENINEKIQEKSITDKQIQNNSGEVKYEKQQLIPLQQGNESDKIDCEKQEQSHLPKYRKQKWQLTKLTIAEPKKTGHLESFKCPAYVHPKKMYLDQNAKSKESLPSASTSSFSSFNDANINKVPVVSCKSFSKISENLTVNTVSNPKVISPDSFPVKPHKTVQIFDSDPNLADIAPSNNECMTTFLPTDPYPALLPMTPTTPGTLQTSVSFDSVSSASTQAGCDTYGNDMALSHIYKNQYETLKLAREPDGNVYKNYSNTSGGSLRRSSVISNASGDSMRRSSVISYCSDNPSENYASSFESPAATYQIERHSLSDSDQQYEFYGTNPESSQIENQMNKTTKLPSISTFNLPWKCPNLVENSIHQDIIHNKYYDTANSESFFHKTYPHSNPYIPHQNDKIHMTNEPARTTSPFNAMKNRTRKVNIEQENVDEQFGEPSLSSLHNISPHRYNLPPIASEPIFVHSFLTHIDEVASMDNYKGNIEDNAVIDNQSDFLDHFYHRMNEDHNFALKKGTIANNTLNDDMQSNYYDIPTKYLGKSNNPSNKAQNIPLNLSTNDNVSQPVSSIITSSPNKKYQNPISIYDRIKPESFDTLTPKSVENFIYKPQDKSKQMKSLKDENLYCYTCNKSGALVPSRKKYLHLYFGPHTCQDCNALLLCENYFFTLNQKGACRHKRKTPYKFPFQFLSKCLPSDEGSSEVVTIGRYLQKLIFLCFRQPWFDTFNKCLDSLNSLANNDAEDDDNVFYEDSINTDEESSKKLLKRKNNSVIQTSKTRKTKKKKFHVYETLKAKKAMALKHFDEIAFILQKQTYIHREASVRESIISSNHDSIQISKNKKRMEAFNYC